MDLIQNILNVIVPPLMIISLFIVYPLYLIYKLLHFIKRLITSENVAGKVVLVTGAASGIGEQICYEYARRRARLVLVDITDDLLGRVVRNVRSFGSPEVISITADVSKEDDCKRFVEEAVKHFHRLDHLVNNAGIARVKLYEEIKSFSDFSYVMDVNFWGGAYATHFAIAHLRKTRGKIIVMASSVGWYPFPRFSFYNASKAAVITFYETLRTEIGNSNIGITIVTPGLVKSALSQTEPAKSALGCIPMASPEQCGKAIVRSACRGDKYVVEPSWVNSLYLLKVLCPDLVESCNRFLFITSNKTAPPINGLHKALVSADHKSD
ncbi:hydroxysteroid dehydrogenase 6 [Hibiscus trionum]|nr:hydroxysteroid dehydrogenase 6 [Hibiscus trionum]